MPRAASLCHGLRDMPRAAFLCHGLRLYATGCVTCHGLRLYATGCVTCHGLRDMPRAAFLCHGLRFYATGCVTCHGLRFYVSEWASYIGSPIRSMVLYGPVFRREVRVPWLPLLGPLLGPWSPVVPYFVGRFARGFLYLVPY
jgi:hypothetical protein